MIFWGIFYTITTFLLGYFFIKEKKVMEYIKTSENKFLEKIDLKGNDSDRFKGNVTTIISLIFTVIFFFLIDRTPDPLIKLKNIGIYGVFAINVGFYILRKEHEYILLLNLIMLFLGKLMFNILDINFYIYLVVNIFISMVLIYLFRIWLKNLLERKLKKEEKVL